MGAGRGNGVESIGTWGRRILDAAAVVTAAGVLAGLFGLVHLPSPALFGGVIAGLVRALGGHSPAAVPAAATVGAQAVIGVTMGALVDLGTLRAVAAHWLPVLLVTVGTLALSLLAGLVLRLQPGISPVTGAFAMIAGGASGIVVMARELGADERLVAVLQYLRVLLIVVLMPVAATTVYGASAGSGSAAADAASGWAAALLFTAVCVAVGLPAGRLLRIPVAAMLGPMLTAAVAGLALGLHETVPALVQNAAFLVIGLQVGLNFTRASLRTIGRALPLALAVIACLILACAGLGVLLSALTGASALDGYLATTPGGLYAVLATASGGGADTTFVLSVQVLRLFVMLLSAPLIARLLRRSVGRDVGR